MALASIDLAIPGWFHQLEANAILQAALALEAVCPTSNTLSLIESGTWCGRSADVFARGLSRRWQIHTVDPYPGYPEGFLYDSDPAARPASEAKAFAHKALVRYRNVFMYDTTMTTYGSLWRIRQLDARFPPLLFALAVIDGWHEPDAVKADAEALLPMMDGAAAFVFFHDAEHWRFGEGVKQGIASIQWPACWRRDTAYEARSLHCYRNW